MFPDVQNGSKFFVELSRIPLPSANPQKMLNPQAVDGDHATCLILRCSWLTALLVPFQPLLPLS